MVVNTKENTLSEKINNMKTDLKIAAVGAVSSYSTQMTAQNMLPSEKENETTTMTITSTPKEVNIEAVPEISGKTISFEKAQELPQEYAAINRHTEYIMNVDDWRNDGSMNVKRVDSREIYNHEVTSVMENREGQKGDIVNLNKARTRMFIFQGNEVIAKNFVRSLYCSPDENLHNMAAKYIKNTPENAEILEKARKQLYTEDGELKTGVSGVLERQKALRDMNKLSVVGITERGATPKSPRRFSNAFINDIKKLSSEHYDELMKAEKEYAIAFYPIENGKNIPAKKAKLFAQKNGLRDASCVSVGNAGVYLSSSIAFGCNSERNLAETKVLNKAKECNRCNYITLETARQLAIAGYEGADDMYSQFNQKVKDDKQEIKEMVDKILAPDETQKVDMTRTQRPATNSDGTIIRKDGTEKTLNLQQFLQKRNSGR